MQSIYLLIILTASQ